MQNMNRQQVFHDENQLAIENVFRRIRDRLGDGVQYFRDRLENEVQHFRALNTFETLWFFRIILFPLQVAGHESALTSDRCLTAQT